MTIEAFDVGNMGNAGDIRVRFSADQVAKVHEFRLLMIPETELAALSLKDALKLSPDHYMSVSVRTDPDYSNRLDAILDSEGNAPSENVNYVVKVLMIGDGFNQLSDLSSNPVSLQDRPAYEGFYKGIISPPLTSFTEVFTMDLTAGSSGEQSYNGLVEYDIGSSNLAFEIADGLVSGGMARLVK